MLADSLAKVSASKRFRRYLMQGSLTLLSPYHPHSGFNAGNAMARNKYIYGLADWGLVVSAAVGEGGTWAGAIEAVRGGQVPVFVRFDVSTPVGNTRLAESGALLFPDPPWDSLARQLTEFASSRPTKALPRTVRETGTRKSRRAELAGPQLFTAEATAQPVVTTQTPPAQPPETALVPISPAPPASIFDTVWPVLQTQLREPRSKQYLAKALELREPQLQDWLERAVSEAKAVKIPGRPIRYQVAPASLFKAGQ
jgi:predicted Rossmann fold nucleotide-binding protein DprA/Smf involved in DNA uptake